MLDIRWIRENPQALATALEKRGWSAEKSRSTVDDLISKDEARRDHVTELQQKQERRNQASKEIGNAMRSGDMALAERLKGEVGEIKAFVQNGEARERELDKVLDDALAVLPNVPLDDVPVGRDEHDNVEVRRVGEPRRINSAKEHWQIGEAMGLMDSERAAKLSGSRFTVLKGQLARLERALGQFMLDLHTTEHDYMEVQPPLLVRDDAMFGTGQLPKFGTDLFFSTERREVDRIENLSKTLTMELINNVIDSFHFSDIQKYLEKELPNTNLSERDTYRKYIEQYINGVEGNPVNNRWFSYISGIDQGPLAEAAKRLWLIPTAEVPLTNLVAKEILEAKNLPLRYTALTPCFRSEAGSAGKDTRGMLRQHQFYKVELVSITDENSSIDEHERMTACAEEVLKRLGLPFRTVVLCTGDMGFGARKTYDIEVWLPGQGAYREISSCSNTGDFQARRMNARYRPEGEKKTAFVHTLNGSGLAVGRTLVAVMENYQQEDGSVAVPEALAPYMGGVTKLEPAA